MAEKKIPSKGYLFYYTTDPAHVVDYPTAPAALPTTYPLAGGDLSTWTRVICVSEPSGMGDAEQETTEHRCGDPETAVVEDFPTGFVNLNDAAFMTTWDRDKYDAFRALRDARTKIRYLFVYPLRAGEVQPSRYGQRGYVKAVAQDMTRSPMMMTVTLTPTDDTGVFVKGTDT